MFLWIIQISLISIIFIFLVHNIISFFKTTLTVPKIKDLVTTPTQKYESMFNVMSANKSNAFNNNNNNNNNNNDDVDYDFVLANDAKDSSSMKDELKNFLKQQLNPNESSQPSCVNTTDISTLDSLSSGNYSPY
jgi:hypothetical protein